MKKKRFVPMERTALDGKTWWVVFDRLENRYSNLTCFGKYKTKKDCILGITCNTIHFNIPNTI